VSPGGRVRRGSTEPASISLIGEKYTRLAPCPKLGTGLVAKQREKKGGEGVWGGHVSKKLGKL